MDCRCLLVVLFFIYGVTWCQDEKNCDNYDSYNDCYECNDDSDECITCNGFEEADCDKCGCVYTAVAYVVSIIFWICIYICCGFCCKYFCCNDQNQPINRNAPLLNKKPGNINSAWPTKHAPKVVNTNVSNNVTVEKLEGEGKSTTMKCTQCFCTYTSKCEFCSKCGAKLQKEWGTYDVKVVNDNDIVNKKQIDSEVPKAAYVKCQNCGKNNSTSFITHGCWKCGKPINIQ